MPPKPLTLLSSLLAAVSYGAMAQAVELELQFSPDIESPVAAKTSDAPKPTFLDADRLHGVQDRYVEAEGNVLVRRLDESMRADRLRYDQVEDRVHATGNVVIHQGGLRIEGDALHLQLATKLGEMRPVRYETQGEGVQYGRGEAEVLKFEGEGQYRLSEASYTTCPVGDDAWMLKTKDLDLDKLNNLGVARNVKVEYLGVPILYTPYMDFALDGSRKSGLLPPTIGASDKRGAEVAVPWYWNIAPNYDATITPRYMSSRGLQLGGEFRYLQADYSGKLDVEYLPNDTQARRDRSLGRLEHAQRFSPRLTGNLLLEGVSDDNYFRDLSSLVGQTSQTNLPRQGSLAYQGDDWKATGLVQSFQTLQDPLVAVTEPFQRLPQIAVSAAKNRYRGLPVDLAFGGEAAHFVHSLSSMPEGNRVYAYPSVKFPFTTSYAHFTPKLGWHLTRYELDRNNQGAQLDQTRSLPIVSLDTGLEFERDWHFGGANYLQTLEPRLYYVYAPYRDQSSLPIFDTGLRDLGSLYSLFAENQFAGVDRINDANQLTVALTSRLLQPETGIERLQLTVGQRFYFEDQRVVLPGMQPRASNTSDILAELSGQLTQKLRLRGGLQIDTNTDQVTRTSFGGQYRDGPGRLINLDYRYNENPATRLDQIDLSAQWPLAPRWYGLGRVNYSFVDQRVLEGLFGFEYNAGCWSVRGVLQRLAITSNQTTDAFFLQLELRDLTKLGPSPLEALKRSIPGYAKSDEFDLP